jgi:CRP/FNR family transcriptional regulator
MGIALSPTSFESSHVAQSRIRDLRDEMLFRPGDPRTQLYQIEQGIVALYRKATGNRSEIIEFAFAGDVVGYGLRETHAAWTYAVGKVRARCIPLSALDDVLRYNKRAFDRYARALQQEFEYRRHQLACADRKLPNRLAALFVVLSRQAGYEGRDPTHVSDSLECGVVASWLGVGVEELADALLQLQHMHLIECCPPHGMRLADLDALESIAD